MLDFHKRPEQEKQSSPISSYKTIFSGNMTSNNYQERCKADSNDPSMAQSEYLKAFIKQNQKRQQVCNKQRLQNYQERIRSLQRKLIVAQSQKIALRQKAAARQEKHLQSIRRLSIQNEMLKSKLKAKNEHFSYQSQLSTRRETLEDQIDLFCTPHKESLQMRIKSDTLKDPISNLCLTDNQEAESIYYRSCEDFQHFQSNLFLTKIEKNKNFQSKKTIKNFPHRDYRDQTKFRAYELLEIQNQELKKLLRKLIYQKQSKHKGIIIEGN